MRTEHLNIFLQDHKSLRPIGINSDTQQIVVAGNREELTRVASCACETAAELATGIRGVGRLLTSADFEDKGVPDSAIEDIGKLLDHVGAAIHGLMVLAENANGLIASDEADPKTRRFQAVA